MNSTDVDTPTQADEGLAEEAQHVGTAEEPPPSSLNQSEPTTTEENTSTIEGPVLEEPIVPPLNQTEILEPGENFTTPNATSTAALTQLILLPTNATTRLNGKISFVRGIKTPRYEIYVMNGDGSEPTRLTNNDVIDRHPTWSPDGEKIAFVSDRDAGKTTTDIRHEFN